MSQPLQPSRSTARNYLAQISHAICAANEGTRVPSTALVWPHGFDRSILHSLPISVRTRNCFLLAKLMEGDTPLTAVDLLRLPNFGHASLTDLLLNVEKFLLNCARTAMLLRAIQPAGPKSPRKLEAILPTHQRRPKLNFRLGTMPGRAFCRCWLPLLTFSGLLHLRTLYTPNSFASLRGWDLLRRSMQSESMKSLNKRKAYPCSLRHASTGS